MEQNTPFFEGVQQQKNQPQNPGNVLSDALLISRFQNFAAGAAKKNHQFLETALRAVLIDQLCLFTSLPTAGGVCFFGFYSNKQTN